MTAAGTVAGHFFATERLVARRFDDRDLAALVAIRADPEVARYQSWETCTEAEARTFLDGLAQRNPGDPGWFQFALARKDDGTFIGDCGLKIVESDARLAQIGYTIARGMWGRGFGTEAVRGLVAYAFATFPIHRISASVDPRNYASVRVLEKAGFAKEAHLRAAEWFKGGWADDAVYARLRSDPG